MLFEFLEPVLPEGWISAFRKYPVLLDFFVMLPLVGLLMVWAQRRGAGGGNGDGYDLGDNGGNGE
jgi:hypothetical protein